MSDKPDDLIGASSNDDPIDDDPKTAAEPTDDPSLVVPYIPDLDGVWCFEPRASRLLYGMFENFVKSGFDVSTVHPEVTAEAALRKDKSLTERYVSMYNEGVAVVNIAGALMKEEPPSSLINASAISYTQITELLAELVEDDGINKIILKIASNGGSTEGMFQCADSIYDFGKKKPIIAFCDDKCNSAAYLLASQCKRIIAGEGSVVGSIGVMVVLTDESKKDEMLGYKRHVVSSTPLKGLGADKKVSKELLKEVQSHVDDYYALFRERVIRGRKMTEEEMDKAATGSVFLPAEATELKLIDETTNFYNLIDITAETDDDDDSDIFPEEGGYESMAMTPEEQAKYDEAIKKAEEYQAQIDAAEESKAKAAKDAARREAQEKQEIQAKLDEAEQKREELAKQVAEMEAQKAETEKQRAEQELANRKTFCLNWIQQHVEAGAIQPANVPKLKAFLGIVLPINRSIEADYTAADGVSKQFSGQLYQFALEIIGENVTTKKVDFSEQASNKGASDASAGVDTWFEDNLAKDGVKLDDDQVLAKPQGNNGANGADLPAKRDLGIADMQGW